MKRVRISYLRSVSVLALAVSVAGAAAADPQLDAVLQRLDKLEKENAKLKTNIKTLEERTVKPPVSAHSTASVKTSPATLAAAGSDGSGFVQVSMPKDAYGVGAPAGRVDVVGAKDGQEDDWYFRHQPGPGLIFVTPNGQVSFYGQLDVSLDATTKGISDKLAGPDVFGNIHPVGNVGWLPALSTNLSFVGVRGFQNIGDSGVRFVYQLETGIDVTAQSGIAESDSNQSNVVRGALTTRDSFVGVESDWGAIKGGKGFTPYRNTTQIMNPFSGMLGDYNVVMGNTGGDNRVEFSTRLDHAIWYESPTIKAAGGVFNFAALYAPGQNRASNSDNIAAGESDCAGGNNPNSGGFTSCSDGSFSDAVSVSATYQTQIPLGGGGSKDGGGSSIGVLITGGYERHQKVNRSSDILAVYGVGNPGTGAALITGSAIGDRLYNQDVADEDAAKVGVQFKLPTKTTISGIYETLHRYVPADLQFQNERQRDGTWLAVTQDITSKDSLAFGWAHAFRAPGDPGQHNDAFLTTGDCTGYGGCTAYASNHNGSDMLTVAYKHTLYPGLMWYVDYAATINEPSAHYDLGAGGRGVTTDCHDANNYPSSAGGIGSNPHCWTGGLLQGVSTGIRYNF